MSFMQMLVIFFPWSSLHLNPWNDSFHLPVLQTLYMPERVSFELPSSHLKDSLVLPLDGRLKFQERLSWIACVTCLVSEALP